MEGGVVTRAGAPVSLTHDSAWNLKPNEIYDPFSSNLVRRQSDPSFVTPPWTEASIVYYRGQIHHVLVQHIFRLDMVDFLREFALCGSSSSTGVRIQTPAAD